jgi:3-oxoacyl-[acyl-carrier-protein] synthase-1
MESVIMSKVWFVSDSIISPLGISSAKNYERIASGETGIGLRNEPAFSSKPIHASCMSNVSATAEFTRFEKIAHDAIAAATQDISLPADRTVFILSTTKGNIEFLESENKHPRINLHASANHLASYFGFKKTIIVSNACISGVMALMVAQRYILSGRAEHAIVVGAEVLSNFIVSGFQSLYALSDSPCKPFDKNRSGISLGEAAGAVVLSSKPQDLGATPTVQLLGGGLTNDANHISGPSRTGKELASAIFQALHASDRVATDIDFISAHGTATLYNDEMEAKAFNLSGLSDVPLNSLKGYFGHTLGAAGIIETLIGLHSLYNNKLIPTKGYESLGVSQHVNVIDKIQVKPLSTFLKTASGFGGCNAAILLQKTKN